MSPRPRRIGRTTRPVRHPVAPSSPVGKCRWCNADVLWLAYREPGGKLAPIDLLPAPGGNIIVDRAMRTYSIVAKDELTLFDATIAVDRDANPTLHFNHWATCRSVTARRLAKERQRSGGRTGPLVTVDGDVVGPVDPDRDPLAPPPELRPGFAICIACGNRMDRGLWLGGERTHPNCPDPREH